MSAYSILEATESAYFSSVDKIVGTGTGSNYAIAKLKKVTTGWDGITFSGNVEFESSDYPQNTQYNKYCTITTPAQTVEYGLPTVTIASDPDGCTGPGSTPITEPKTDTNYPLTVNLGTTYTYAMEDLWPNYGDYDMPVMKRLFDIAFSILAILCLSPLLILTAIAIRIESKGPVVYKSKRVGSNYRIFDFLKFRSMLFIFLGLLLKTNFTAVDWKRTLNPLTYIILIWLIYCLLELLNPKLTSVTDWYTKVRSIVFYPTAIIILTSTLLTKYKHIKNLLLLWSILILFAAFKGYWQKNHGFDSAELTWLYSGGGRTHLISTGIRYFSFFSDAGNYGSNMGFSLVIFSIAAFYIKNKWLKFYFIIVALAGGYGMN